MKQQEILTLDKSELEAILRGFLDAYDADIRDKINKEVGRVIRDNSVNIFCGKCDQNILIEKEPTVFGAKGKGKSSTYHMECWRAL